MTEFTTAGKSKFPAANDELAGPADDAHQEPADRQHHPESRHRQRDDDGDGHAKGGTLWQRFQDRP
ncbi:hypothetical protein [Actinomadura kijaniata]|uniref:hypothetical protein n=1 Tax=Actinomadura kijaniata TaxID=46161 RepID=UPI00083761AD|nr:hypothetical protein [Actinomadura kijaniata]